uniref:Uncharacterized protein n=1 Tax=Salix viminalis TaxID=40686 RepID=A0A6N2NDT6_SALVM
MSPEQSQYIWRKTIPHIEVGMGSGVFTSYRSARGNALQSEVLRLREEMFLVNAGLGTPEFVCKMSLQECQSTEPPGSRIKWDSWPGTNKWSANSLN